MGTEGFLDRAESDDFREGFFVAGGVVLDPKSAESFVDLRTRFFRGGAEIST